MQPKRFCTATLVLVLSVATANADTVLRYDLTGLRGSGTPPTSASPTTANGVTGSQLTRGPGLGAGLLANGFSSNDWSLNSSAAIAITNGDYYEWSFTVLPDTVVSLSAIDFNLRRSAVAAASNYDLYASTDGFATAPAPGGANDVATFNYKGRSSGTAPGTVTPFQWMTTDTPGQDNGNLISPQDLSTQAYLQNLLPGTTITFRLYAWTNDSGAAASNTVSFGRVNGPNITGTVLPEPTGSALLGLGSVCLVGRRRRRA